MDDLLEVLTKKQAEWSRLKEEAKYYKDEVFKIKKRKQKEALKSNDGTLQDDYGDNFRICTGKRPYVCFAKNSEIDPLLAKENKWKWKDAKETQKLRSKNRDWIEGKCVACSHILWKICKYIWNGCKAILCPDCHTQCTKCFDFVCDKCECSWGSVKVKILRS